MNKWTQTEAFRKIAQKYIDLYDNQTRVPDKVFYHFNEWYGWKFYKKAIINKDWKSIIGHIKEIYG